MITITGFEPFRGEKVNPSMVIAEELDGKVIFGEEVKGVVLPVSYKKAKPIVESLVREKPKLLLSLGLSPKTTCVRLEVVALNIAHSEKGDNDGYKPFNETIYEDGDLAYRGTLPFNTILKALRGKGIPSILSFHAGTFLCNYVYYVALYNARSKNIRIGFLHIPHLTDYAVKKPEVPSLPKELIIEAVKIIIEESLKNSV